MTPSRAHKRPDTRTTWWTVARPNRHAALRLFVFPYGGSGGSICRLWHRLLPGDLEIHGIQLPGRGPRIAEPPMRRMPELTRMLGTALQPLLDRPFAFFGHSLGAVLAFDVARHVRRRWGLHPCHLFVGGRRAPQLPVTESFKHELGEQEFIDHVRDLQGTPPEVLADAELLALSLPALRADFELSETYEYTPEPPLAMPITVFGGRDDPESGGGRLEAWQAQTTGPFRIELLDGDHFFIHSSERQLLAILEAQLTESGCRNLSPAR
jgi:medium-chain acyl-[acyl-carrier-protein] hydrolase